MLQVLEDVGPSDIWFTASTGSIIDEPVRSYVTFTQNSTWHWPITVGVGQNATASMLMPSTMITVINSGRHSRTQAMVQTRTSHCSKSAALNATYTNIRLHQLHLSKHKNKAIRIQCPTIVNLPLQARNTQLYFHQHFISAPGHFYLCQVWTLVNNGGNYEIGRSVRVCVCVHVIAPTVQAAMPAVTLTSLPCSEAALPSASPFLVFTSLHLAEICTLTNAF